MAVVPEQGHDTELASVSWAHPALLPAWATGFPLASPSPLKGNMTLCAFDNVELGIELSVPWEGSV